MASRADQARRTRAAVLDTARALFAEQGYDATSLQQIADRLGITKANVYYYFRTKDAILQGLLSPIIEALSEVLDRAEGVAGREERLRVMVAGFVAEMVTAYRAMGPLNLGDPGLRRHAAVSRALDRLAERGLRLAYGEHPTPDQIAGWWLTQDLTPVLHRLGRLPDPDLVATLERLCMRTLRV